MGQKTCPHCGNSLAETATSCPCGLDLEEMELPGPGVVREPVQGTVEADDGPPPAKPRGVPVKLVKKKKEAAVQAPAAPPAAGAKAASPGTNLMIACPGCGVRISKRARQCPKCGAAPFANCQICAAQIVSNSPSCPECGDPDPFLEQTA